MFEVREKPKMVERALLVGVQYPQDSEETVYSLLHELSELVETLRIEAVDLHIARIREPKARYLLGSGKAEEIDRRLKELRCDCLVFDCELTPAQQRNWELLTGACVIDRQEVILDIFSERAQTKEAVLQVELARAEHSLPRLKNAWTHLSRQRGGGTTQRGEGEAQIELDSRMVRQRIARLRKELDEVVQHRGVQRKRRQRVPLPTAAIVGYTNAGKSTLLNALTGAGVLTEDKLFATLDPTTRQLDLPSGRRILLTDTVGFVRKLPHGLVEAFKATLEEAVVADFLVHVVDITNPEVEAHQETTLSVLKELGADEKRIITVFNKADALNGRAHLASALLNNAQRQGSSAVLVSAHTRMGLRELQTEMDRILAEDTRVVELLIPHARYDVVSRLHEAGVIRHKENLEEGVHLVSYLPDRLTSLTAPFLLNGNGQVAALDQNGHGPARQR